MSTLDIPQNPQQRGNRRMTFAVLSDTVKEVSNYSESPGQIIFSVVSKLTKILDYDVNSNVAGKFLTEVWIDTVGAQAGEFFIFDNDILEATVQKQARGKYQKLNISDKSLPGRTALTREFCIISNAHSSTDYNQFTQKIYVNDKNEMPNSVLSVPLIAENRQLLGVMVLFNKVRSDMSLSFFTDEDVHIVKACGLVVEKVLQKQKQISKINNQLANVNEERRNQEAMLKIWVNSVRRKNLITRIRTIFANEPIVTYDIARIFCEIMNCQGLIIHICQEGKLIPYIGYGMCVNPEEYESMQTETSLYVRNQREILNIKDLKIEPLWKNHTWCEEFKSGLCTSVQTDESVTGVLEFLKKEGTFNEYDERLSTAIVQELLEIEDWNSNISFRIPGIFSQQQSNIDQILQEDGIKNMVDQTLIFRQEIVCSNLDYVRFLSRVEKSVHKSLRLEQCTVYLVNAEEQIIWTRKSEASSVVSCAVDLTSTVGVWAAEGRAIIGNAKELKLPDQENFVGQEVLWVPVFSHWDSKQVLGVILCLRNDSAFEDDDVKKLMILTPSLQICLETFSQAECPILADSQRPIIGSTAPLRSKVSSNSLPSSRSYNKIPQPIQSRSIKQLKIKDIDPIPGRKKAVTVSDNMKKMHHTRSFSNEKLNQTSNPGIEALQWIRDILSGPHQEQMDELFDHINEDQDRIATTLIEQLTQVWNAEAARFYMLDDTKKLLIDLQSKSALNPTGLITASMMAKEICIEQSPTQELHYNSQIDNCGLETLYNLMWVPIFNLKRENVGVIAVANGTFDQQQISLATFISLILFFTFGRNKSSQKSSTGRRLKMLLYWCKEVFQVSINSQQNQQLSKEIIYAVATNASFDENLDISINVMQAVTWSEGCEVYFMDPNTQELKIYLQGEYSPPEDYTGDVERVIKQGKAWKKQKTGQYESMLIVPMSLNSRVIGAIKLWNRVDDTHNHYCQYNEPDEDRITHFASVIGEVYTQFSLNGQGELNKLKETIRHFTNQMNTLPLIGTIRRAAQILLNCDRGTVFSRKGNSMFVQAQGDEHEIPVGFQLPLGVGIVGHVAKMGVTERIKDVYDDPRFNKEMDRRSGYKTTSMLCMPVFNAQHEVIAAMQMINKKNGHFDDEDVQILEMFGEMASSALQNLDLFTKNMEERTNLLSILNSMKSYILVFNVDGCLNYCNQQIAYLFGIDEKKARQHHFSVWIHKSCLIRDLNSVLKNPQNVASRKWQTLEIPRLQRDEGIHITSPKSQNRQESLQISYYIMSLKDFETQEVKGLVLRIEDVTDQYKMKEKMSKMDDQLQRINKYLDAGISTEKPLHTVIDNLRKIAAASPGQKAAIEQQIQILKAGNLDKPKIHIGQEISDDLVQFIDQEYVPPRRHTIGGNIDLSEPQSPAFQPSWDAFATKEIDLQLIREWDIDVWQIEDHVPYIYTIVNDLDLIKRFRIDPARFVNFISEIRTLYGTVNPYHNWFHGFNVFHCTYMLLTATHACNSFDPSDILALLVAGLCHDVNHTGRNNAFEMNSESMIALQYHDQSVLEQHHAAQTFMVLKKDNCNIFKNMRPDDRKSVRKLIISTILATDMSKHFGMIGDMNARFDEMVEVPLGSKDNDKLNLAEMLIHTADLCNSTKSFDMLYKWSKQVNQEFTAQVADEKRLGIPVTEFMQGLDDPKVYFKNELGFNKFVVLPLWVCIDKWLNPHIKIAMQNLENNVARFQEESDRANAASEQ